MLYLVQIQISSSGRGPPVKSVGRKYKRAAVPYKRIAYWIAKEHDSGHYDMKDKSPSGIWGRIAVNLNWPITNAKRKSEHCKAMQWFYLKQWRRFRH